MKKNYSKFLVVLLALAMILPGFTQLASADSANPEVIRITGKTRVQTAINVSKKAYGNGEAKTVILAGYHGEADALTGTLLAKKENAPMLLTLKDKLDPALEAEMTRLGVEKVYILGGTHAVSAKVQEDLRAKGLEVKRITGSTRVETAANIAKEVFGTDKPEEAFFVEYKGIPDALAIGPVAANGDAPILITQTRKVPQATKDAIDDMDITKGTIIGGNNTLSDEGKLALEAEVGATVPRVYGSDRVQTSLEIAKKYFENPKAVVVADGWKYADALVGGYFAAMKDAPILLTTRTNNIDDAILAYIKTAHVDTYVLGGTSAVSASVFTKIQDLFKQAPVVEEKYEVKLSAKDSELVGDGKTNTTIEAYLVKRGTNEIKEVNGYQVRLTTTHGTLSDEVLTLQNGRAHTTLNSRAVSRDTDVFLNAQIIEASVPVADKEKITGMTADLKVVFTVPTGGPIDNIPKLVKAESNQADRVTLYFDREVNPKDFTTLNTNVVIKQEGYIARTVEGFYRLEGNDKRTIEAILSTNTVLIDNKEVSVSATLTRNGYSLTRTVDNFILTDNTKPQVTDVIHDGNMRTIKVVFSEAIKSAEFSLDGGASPIKSVIYGTFDGVGQVDERHIVTLNVEYLDADEEHVLQVSAPKDYAYASDPENVGSTQKFKIKVTQNLTVPNATVTVESPEQYRIKLEGVNPKAPLRTGRNVNEIELQMQLPNGTWENVRINVGHPGDYPNHALTHYMGYMNVANPSNGNYKLIHVEDHEGELVVETNTDWTYVFDTDTTNDNFENHNFRLVIPAEFLVNDANNKDNVLPIYLPLDLNLPDNNKSPEMVGIEAINKLDDDGKVIFEALANGRFDLEFNKPVKGIDLENEEVGETPSQQQHKLSGKLPNIVVEYKGTDKNGVVRTIPGKAFGYADNAKGKDTKIAVKADKDLRDLVDKDCYDQNWEVIVRNVTDDIGNSAKTITQAFTITPTPAPARTFKIANANLLTTAQVGDINVNVPTEVNEAAIADNYDIVRVEYSDFIRLADTDDTGALNKSNYKLFNRDLGEGSFVLVDLDSEVVRKTEDGKESVWNCLCRYKVNGFNAVYIFKPKQTTTPTSFTLEVNENLTSKDFAWGDGVKLSGPQQVELPYTSTWSGFGDCVYGPNINGQ